MATAIAFEQGQRVRIVDQPSSIWTGYAGREGEYLGQNFSDHVTAVVLLDNATGVVGYAGTQVQLAATDLELVVWCADCHAPADPERTVCLECGEQAIVTSKHEARVYAQACHEHDYGRDPFYADFDR